jgi:hypothetical protein
VLVVEVVVVVVLAPVVVVVEIVVVEVVELVVVVVTRGSISTPSPQPNKTNPVKRTTSSIPVDQKIFFILEIPT